MREHEGKCISKDPFDSRRERSPQTVTSKVSTGASKIVYQTRPRTVAFPRKHAPFWVIMKQRWVNSKKSSVRPPSMSTWAVSNPLFEAPDLYWTSPESGTVVIRTNGHGKDDLVLLVERPPPVHVHLPSVALSNHNVGRVTCENADSSTLNPSHSRGYIYIYIY